MSGGVEFPNHIEGCRVNVEGWTVPLLTAFHEPGGQTLLLIDKRLGYSFDAASIDNATRFAADLIATCWGYGAHPRDENFDRARFSRVPHFVLQPRHCVEITSATTEDLADSEDKA